MNVLLNLGRAVNEATEEFRGRTPAELATAAHSAYVSMLGLQLPSPGTALGVQAPPTAPARRKRAKRAKKAKPAAKTARTDDKTVSIMEVLRKAKKPIPASEISERTGIPGQGLGPTLNMMFGNGDIVKKEVDGVKVWGTKTLNGKAAHAPN